MPTAEPVPTRARMILRPALLLGGLLLLGLALRAVPGLRPDGLRTMVGHGPAGMAWLVAIGALITAVGAPRQVVAFAGGALFGPGLGTGLALLAQILACAADVAWARAVARDWARRRLLRGRLARLERFLAANPFTATLMLRLLPVGNNLLLSLLAGVMGLPLPRFLLASLLGYAPQTVVFALLGEGVRVGRGVQVGIGLVLFAAASGMGYVLMRRLQRSAGPTGADPISADPISAGSAGSPVANPRP